MNHIIWMSDIDIDKWDIDPELVGEMTDDEKWQYCAELNNEYLEDERLNLRDCPVYGRIIAIADCGLWYGRRTAYKYLDSVSDCLYTTCDYAEWYCDEYNFRAKMVHHDGTNYVLYRILKPELSDKQIETFENKIIDNAITRKDISRYTKSLRPAIAKVYGWPQFKPYSKKQGKKISAA